MVEERGPVVQVVAEFHKSIRALEGRGQFPEHLLDNYLLESPIHSIDLVRAVAGSEVAEVHSVVRRTTSRYKDVHAALVEFENGCVAQLTFNLTTDARLERYEIHGREISAYLEGVKTGSVFANGQQTDLDGTVSDGTVEQARFFLDCVKNDRPVSLPAANLDEAVKTMELAERILAGPQG
jgi:predicted dehydrogenase